MLNFNDTKVSRIMGTDIRVIPRTWGVEWCSSKDGRDFKVLLHSLYHIKGKAKKVEWCCTALPEIRTLIIIMIRFHLAIPLTITIQTYMYMYICTIHTVYCLYFSSFKFSEFQRFRNVHKTKFQPPPSYLQKKNLTPKYVCTSAYTVF